MTTYTIVNMTPHAITVVGHDPIPPSGDVARVSVTDTPAGYIGDYPVSVQETGEVEGLPDPVPGVYYIVSTMVRLALPDRLDLLSPGQLVRDDAGRPIGCQTLNRNGGV